MAARKNRGVSLAAVRRWPAVVNVETAADALGVSRATLYSALARGERPVQVIVVGRRMRVLTASLLKALDGEDGEAARSA